MIRLILFSAVWSGIAAAQTQTNYVFNLDNGGMVLYQVYSELPVEGGHKAVAKTEASGNRIRRVLVKPDGLPWLGFDLHIDRTGNDAAFRLAVQPIDGVPFFRQPPVVREVRDGDRVLLDVLEQPNSGRKVFDTFQVGLKGTPMQIMPMSLSVPNLLDSGAVLKIDQPRLVKGVDTIVESASSLTGSKIALDWGPAVFAFSAVPEKGYRMEGIVEGNTLRFVAGSEQYTLKCQSPIVDRAGAWYVWVMNRAANRSDKPALFVP
jgi:hypothetical protein